MAARNNDRGAEGRPALDADNSVEFVVKVSQCEGGGEGGEGCCCGGVRRS